MRIAYLFTENLTLTRVLLAHKESIDRVEKYLNAVYAYARGDSMLIDALDFKTIRIRTDDGQKMFPLILDKEKLKTLADFGVLQMMHLE